MELFADLIPQQPWWVVAALATLGVLGYLSRHIREILEVISFKKTRALEAKVELTTGLEWIGQHDNQHVAAVHVNIVNKGAVRLHIDKLEFSVRGISANSPLERACEDKYPRLMSQLYFPNVIDDGSLFPPQWGYAWVDPGCTDAYRHPIAIPKAVSYTHLTLPTIYSV